MRLVSGDNVSSLRSEKLILAHACEVELGRIAEKEGAEAEEMLRHCQITVDNDFRDSTFLVRIEFRGQVFKQFKADLYRMKEQKEIADVAGVAMRGNISLVGQMHFVRLDQLFPRSIKDVEVTYDPECNLKIIKVIFKNGHVAEAPEHEAKTDLFTAKCSMLFDLPPL